MMQRICKQLRLKPSAKMKALNALLVVLLLLGLIPLPARAAPQAPDNKGNKIFLPVVAASTSQVTSSASGGKATPILFDVTPRKFRYAVGQIYQYEYGVQIDTTTAKRDAQGVRAEGSDTTVIHAIANVTITGQDTDGAFSGEVVLQEPSLYHTDGTTTYPLEDTDTLNALAVPLRFKQAVNGVITEVAWPANAQAQVVNIQKGVLNALQVTLIDGQDDYVAQEQAGQGALQVHYKLQEQSDGLHITKQYNQDSFTKLVRAGDPDSGMKLENAIELVLDRNQGVISSMFYNESIASGDGAAGVDPSNTGFDGVTTWSTVKSAGRLSLLTVGKGVAAAAVAGAGLTYTTGSLSAQITEDVINRAGIDLSKIDLNSELTQLENAPDSPEAHARLLALVEAANTDPNNNIDVLKLITGRLQTNAANDAIASAYIDVLASVGTPQAQEILSAVLGNSQIYPTLASAPFGTAAKTQALIDISLVKAPTSMTVETVKPLLKSINPALRDSAATVLGAIANHLANNDQVTAQQLADLLATKLSAARQPADAELYLNAVGNTGALSVLPLIKPYLHATVMINSTGQVTNDLQLQAAALVALRKIPGSDAETLLVDALKDTTQPQTLRVLVANVLHERNDLSKPAQTALDQFSVSLTAAPGSYNYTWTKLLGNNNLGAEFPGGITVSGPPAATGLNANAYQAANAWIFAHSLPIAKGELRSFRQGDYQVFGAYLSLGGYVISRFEQQFQCSASRTGNLFNGTLQVLDVTYSVPIFAVLTLNINVKASGSFSLDWNFSVDFCGITQTSLNAGITPKAWVSAAASAYLQLVFVRGGATLNATLLQTQLPAQASLKWMALPTPSLQFCINIQASTQPLSGYLDVWADVWSWGSWKRIGSQRLWSFSTPSATYPLLVQCY